MGTILSITFLPQMYKFPLHYGIIVPPNNLVFFSCPIQFLYAYLLHVWVPRNMCVPLSKGTNQDHKSMAFSATSVKLLWE